MVTPRLVFKPLHWLGTSKCTNAVCFFHSTVKCNESCSLAAVACPLGAAEDKVSETPPRTSMICWYLSFLWRSQTKRIQRSFTGIEIYHTSSSIFRCIWWILTQWNKFYIWWFKKMHPNQSYFNFPGPGYRSVKIQFLICFLQLNLISGVS